MESTGMSINDVDILAPVIQYTLPNGDIILLKGDPRHDGKSTDGDGFVDLLIDENDPTNYFIDFEIK